MVVVCIGRVNEAFCNDPVFCLTTQSCARLGKMDSGSMVRVQKWLVRGGLSHFFSLALLPQEKPPAW